MDNLTTRPLALALAALLAACSSTPITPPATSAPAAMAPMAAGGTGTKAPQGTTQPTPSSQVATVTLPDYLDPKNPLSTARSVYFDYDDFSVRGDQAAVVERHGTYLSKHPALRIKVVGNADERGSPEYNLALGQKRADTVLRSLRVYGVKDAQVEAISWGEERPKVPGHDESAWAENRRADLQYPPQ